MENFIRWDKKRIACGVIAVIVSSFLFSLTLTAQTDPYSGKTYSWKDVNGDWHVSSYLDRATDINQMKSLIVSLYADKTIPGKKFALNYKNAKQIMRFPATISSRPPFTNRPVPVRVIKNCHVIRFTLITANIPKYLTT